MVRYLLELKDPGRMSTNPWTSYGSLDYFSPSRVNQTCQVSHEGQPEAYSFGSQKLEFVHKYVTACGNQKLFLSQEMLLVRSNKRVWSPQR